MGVVRSLVTQSVVVFARYADFPAPPVWRMCSVGVAGCGCNRGWVWLGVAGCWCMFTVSQSGLTCSGGLEHLKKEAPETTCSLASSTLHTIFRTQSASFG
jgi:hypothetical protein